MEEDKQKNRKTVEEWLKKEDITPIYKHGEYPGNMLPTRKRYYRASLKVLGITFIVALITATYEVLFAKGFDLIGYFIFLTYPLFSCVWLVQKYQRIWNSDKTDNKDEDVYFFLAALTSTAALVVAIILIAAYIS